MGSDWLDQFLSSVGSTASGSKIAPNQSAAGQDVSTAQQDANSLAPPSLTPLQTQTASQQTASPQTVSGNAYDNVATDPSNTAAQKAQLAALSNLAANGGRNAASDAALAQSQQAADADAAGQRGAIMQRAAERGQSNGGTALLAQLSASQGATNTENQRDTQTAANEANTALSAGQAAAGIGSNLEAQQFGEQAAKANAANSIAQFNAGQGTQASEFNAGQGNQLGEFNAGTGNAGQEYNTGLAQTEYGDQAGKVGDQLQASGMGTNYYGNQASAAQAAQGNLLGSVIGAGGKYAAAGAGAGAAAGGGKIPGRASVPGNSYANDTQPAKVRGTGQIVMTSPGEVNVPRSLVQHGSVGEIGHFVKNPPPVPTMPQTGGDKEAMLSALKNLARRGGR